MRKFQSLLIGTALFLFIQPAHSQDCPMHKEHQRGDAVMGFDQNKTIHHFKLQKYGGEIEVRARQGSDTTSIQQIRTHLQQI